MTNVMPDGIRLYGEPHMPVSFSIKHAQDFVNAEGELLMNRTRKLYWV
jgi:hypothetical protein